MPGSDQAEIGRAVNRAAKKAGWIARAGTLSTRRDGIALQVYEFAGRLQFKAKPVVWDDIFWRIMQIAFARKPSPSRHWWGTACHVPILAVRPDAGGSAERIAAARLSFAEREAGRIGTRDFARPPAQRYPPDRPTDFVVAEVVFHLANRNPRAAGDLCEQVITRQRTSSFNFGRAGAGGFFQLARAAIDNGSFDTP